MSQGSGESCKSFAGCLGTRQVRGLLCSSAQQMGSLAQQDKSTQERLTVACWLSTVLPWEQSLAMCSV